MTSIYNGIFSSHEKRNLVISDNTNGSTKIMASSLVTSCQTDGETVETVTDFIFWAPKSLQMVTAAMELKDTCSLEGKL